VQGTRVPEQLLFKEVLAGIVLRGMGQNGGRQRLRITAVRIHEEEFLLHSDGAHPFAAFLPACAAQGLSRAPRLSLSYAPDCPQQSCRHLRRSPPGVIPGLWEQMQPDDHQQRAHRRPEPRFLPPQMPLSQSGPGCCGHRDHSHLSNHVSSAEARACARSAATLSSRVPSHGSLSDTYSSCRLHHSYARVCG